MLRHSQLIVKMMYQPLHCLVDYQAGFFNPPVCFDLGIGLLAEEAWEPLVRGTRSPPPREL
jgi:hypothetical protein